MNDRCKVSIVVPVYNAQAYIEKNLETLLHQSYDNFELIIVDDGSTDESKHIIEKHLNNDNRIKYVYQDNQGAGVARNVGLEMATGKYIIFLDDSSYKVPNPFWNVIPLRSSTLSINFVFIDFNINLI